MGVSEKTDVRVGVKYEVKHPKKTDIKGRVTVRESGGDRKINKYPEKHINDITLCG